jgi:Rrf2 family protein
MILKNQVEWALHCCSILAGIPEGRYLATRDLAELHGVPKEYLSKALQALSQAGLVESTLGPTGGYRLALSPSAITFLDIVEALEGSRSTFACTEIRKNMPCRPAGTRDGKVCAIAQVMYGADEAWRAHLRSVRLSDMLETLQRDLPPALVNAIRKWTAQRA